MNELTKAEEQIMQILWKIEKGFVKDVIEYLRFNTRSQIFAKSVPMPLVKGALKRLELLIKEPPTISNPLLNKGSGRKPAVGPIIDIFSA